MPLQVLLRYFMQTKGGNQNCKTLFKESGFSDNVSDTASPEPASTKVNSPTDSDEIKKSTMSVTSANGGSLRGEILYTVQTFKKVG